MIGSSEACLDLDDNLGDFIPDIITFMIAMQLACSRALTCIMLSLATMADAQSFGVNFNGFFKRNIHKRPRTLTGYFLGHPFYN